MNTVEKAIHEEIDTLPLSDGEMFHVQLTFDIYLPGIKALMKSGKSAKDAIQPMLLDMRIA
jgi:hypothetical protein